MNIDPSIKMRIFAFLQKIRILSVESGAVSTLPLPIITAVREDFQQTCDGSKIAGFLELKFQNEIPTQLKF